MIRYGLFVIVALVLAAALGEPSPVGAAKAPRRPPPRVHHPPRRPAPKPRPAAKKKVSPHRAPKKAAPRPKAPVRPKVKPKNHKSSVARPAKTAKTPKKMVKAPARAKAKTIHKPKHVHKFAHFNERRELRFDPRWWYNFVVYPTSVSPSVAYQADYTEVNPPPTVNVTPPVIKPGQGLPVSPAGRALAALLDGMDVEHHWLPGQSVDWKTGNPISQESGPASNGGAFVAAVCARLKVPMPPPAPESFLPGSQYDWLVTKGKSKGWAAVEPVEAQLLANQGWAVIAAWEDPAPPGERTTSGLTAIVRPDSASAAYIPLRGPLLIGAGALNRNTIFLHNAFPASAWKGNEVVYVAHRPR